MPSGKALIRPFLSLLVSEFPSAAKALTYTREVLKIGIRTKDFYDMWREELGIQKAKTAWETLRMDYRLSLDNIPVSDYKLRQAYLWTAEYEVTLPTGEKIRKTVSYYTSYNPTKREHLEIINSILSRPEVLERYPHKYEIKRVWGRRSR